MPVRTGVAQDVQAVADAGDVDQPVVDDRVAPAVALDQAPVERRTFSPGRTERDRGNTVPALRGSAGWAMSVAGTPPE